MEYNTSLPHLIIPEYGRNIQKMIDFAIVIDGKIVPVKRDFTDDPSAPRALKAVAVDGMSLAIDEVELFNDVADFTGSFTGSLESAISLAETVA